MEGVEKAYYEWLWSAVRADGMPPQVPCSLQLQPWGRADSSEALALGICYTLHLAFTFDGCLHHQNEEMRENKISDCLTICIAQTGYPTIHEIVFIDGHPHQQARHRAAFNASKRKCGTHSGMTVGREGATASHTHFLEQGDSTLTPCRSST